MKVKLFSHSDKDGVGCGVLGKQAFSNIDIEYCDYDNINDKIKQYIVTEEYKNYDMTFITDISVNAEIAELINNIQSLISEFILLDHHKTAEFLNKYSWCKVVENVNGEKTCGTSLFYYYLEDNGFLQNSRAWKWDGCSNLYSFVESVRKYDTYLWKTLYNEIEPKMWNDLLYIMGRDNFIEKIMDIIGFQHEFDFTEFDLKLLEYKQREIDSYIEAKDKSIIVKEIQGYKTGVVFAERYVSELGNKLSELHPELDFIAMINPSHSVSYRTVKKGIDLSAIAKVFGGGGHMAASGSPIDEVMRNRIIDLVFS